MLGILKYEIQRKMHETEKSFKLFGIHVSLLFGTMQSLEIPRHSTQKESNTN